MSNPEHLGVEWKLVEPGQAGVIFEPLYFDVVPPQPATRESAGLDAVAYLAGRRHKVFTRDNTLVEMDDTILLQPGWRAVVPLGFKAKLPSGWECQVRPRSGLALKQGVTVLNSPGTIDADYPGEWGVVLFNASNLPVTIYHGDRVAQLVLAPIARMAWMKGLVQTSTDRQGGFGSTGV